MIQAMTLGLFGQLQKAWQHLATRRHYTRSRAQHYMNEIFKFTMREQPSVFEVGNMMKEWYNPYVFMMAQHLSSMPSLLLHHNHKTVIYTRAQSERDQERTIEIMTRLTHLCDEFSEMRELASPDRFGFHKPKRFQVDELKSIYDSLQARSVNLKEELAGFCSEILEIRGLGASARMEYNNGILPPGAKG